MVILNQNDLRMKKWCRNDRDENPPKMTYFLPNDQGMTHFSHSDVIPSFEDEDEWDEVDQFPYSKTAGKNGKMFEATLDLINLHKQGYGHGEWRC